MLKARRVEVLEGGRELQGLQGKGEAAAVLLQAAAAAPPRLRLLRGKSHVLYHGLRAAQRIAGSVEGGSVIQRQVGATHQEALRAGQKDLI